MLTTAPYLRIRRPSPTTAEFIVSTLPTLTLPLRIALAAIYLLRLVLALALLLLLYSAWAQSPYTSTRYDFTTPPPPAEFAFGSGGSSAPTTPPPPFHTRININSPATLLTFIQDHLHALLSSRPLGHPFATLGASLPPWLLAPISLSLLYLLSQRVGIEERVLVLRGLGIQTSSSGATVLSPLQTRFIPTYQIQDVLLNEAFRGFRARDYLAVAVDGEDALVVVFPRILPPPRILEKVWKGVRECLYENEGGKELGGRKKMKMKMERAAVAVLEKEGKEKV